MARSGFRARLAIVFFGCTIAWVMGVRAPHAASFEAIEFAGKGRATLVIEERGPTLPAAEAEEAPDERVGLVEVFAKMTFGTEVSAFSRGLYVRSSFTLPRTGDTAVLVVDVDRKGGKKVWKHDDRGLRARLYTVPAAGGMRFDGAPASGSIELEASVIGRDAAGFRIAGWLEMVDAGPDGRRDTEDDTTLEVDLTLESEPPPEAIAGEPQLPPREPQGGFCEPPWCWRDDGYDDGYVYGYGCGDADVGYETSGDGCEGDTIDDGSYGVDDGGGVIDDGGTTGSPGDGDVVYDESGSSDGCDDGYDDTSTSSGGEFDSSGCEGSDDGSSSDGCDGGDSGSSSSGCDGSDSGSSGCSDSGDSGCGSSGCEGDTLERAPDPGRGTVTHVVRRPRHAGVDLVGLGLFCAAIATWISDRRRGRGPS